MAEKKINPRLISGDRLREEIIKLIKGAETKDEAMRRVAAHFNPQLYLLQIFEYPEHEFLINVRVRVIEGFQQFKCSR
ncbi:MAG: hypothetical protein JWN37_545 [Candidatus Nomurabacteria bacterium]|nr:hypothetical protein [Candidatus Nomurabacteria bacterium]